jgi:hypothetical protein
MRLALYKTGIGMIIAILGAKVPILCNAILQVHWSGRGKAGEEVA